LCSGRMAAPKYGNGTLPPDTICPVVPRSVVVNNEDPSCLPAGRSDPFSPVFGQTPALRAEGPFKITLRRDTVDRIDNRRRWGPASRRMVQRPIPEEHGLPAGP
jgi:hypothetical protein